MLLEAHNESVLRAVGWDLLHTILPFVVTADDKCAHGARGLLLRVAVVCNPRELFSMVMEGFVFFKVDRASPMSCATMRECACCSKQLTTCAPCACGHIYVQALEQRLLLIDMQAIILPSLRVKGICLPTRATAAPESHLFPKLLHCSCARGPVRPACAHCLPAQVGCG